jgi:hypothetical protein
VKLNTGMLALYSDLKWNVKGAEARAVFTMKAGDTHSFALTHSTEAPSVMPTANEADLELDRTLNWWEKWSSKFTYKGPYSAEVQRSILTLKLLQFAPTTERQGPTVHRQLEPPGFLALNYGPRTPMAIMASHILFGVVIGAVYHM